ncbi:MAG: PIG-L deacetylase family protein, partial [Chloroflexota bacterium]
MTTAAPTGAAADRVDVLAVFAHPDDESYVTGGTLALASARGSRVGLVCLTGGELGFPPGVGPADVRSRADLRRAELRGAAARLGISRLWTFDYPDGSLASLAAELEERLAAIVESCRPRLIVSFSEQGLNGHPDHAAVGAVVSTIVAHVRCQAGAGHVAAPDLWKAVWTNNRLRLVAGGRPPRPPGHAGYVVVNVSSVRRQKREAIRCHRSQLTWRNLAYERVRDFWGREYFSRPV